MYEGEGPTLFDRITHLTEYYPTRAERAILEKHAHSIAVLSGANTVVELGSGASDKTTLLLDAFDEAGQLATFVAFDVVQAVVRSTSADLAERYPDTAVAGVVGDFSDDLALLDSWTDRLVAFLGGTFGNLTPSQRSRFLGRIARLLAPGEHLLIGTDLVKDPARLLAAYDDPGGVTAAFERNVLSVVNVHLGADFDPDSFSYVARWDPAAEVIEMSLRSEGDQDVTVRSLGLSVHFDQGEELLTEISAKFTLAGITEELAAAGFAVVEQWQDRMRDYALTLALRVKAKTISRHELDLRAPRGPTGWTICPIGCGGPLTMADSLPGERSMPREVEARVLDPQGSGGSTRSS